MKSNYKTGSLRLVPLKKEKKESMVEKIKGLVGKIHSEGKEYKTKKLNKKGVIK